MIKVKEIRVIGEKGEQLGILPTVEAMRIALEQDLDLVEVAPSATPPVCRIMNYGKFKYEQQKKEHQAKRRNQGMELKELRLGRSISIEQHDLDFKLKKAREILEKGCRLQIFLQLKGREMAHSGMGIKTLNEFAALLTDVSKTDSPAMNAGRRICMTLAPIAIKKKKLPKPDGTPADEKDETDELDAETTLEPGLEAAPSTDAPAPESGSIDEDDDDDEDEIEGLDDFDEEGQEKAK